MKIEPVVRNGVDSPVVPPFDPKARDRIEQVARKLLDLNATLEARIVALEQRMTDYEDALRELGMAQVPANG